METRITATELAKKLSDILNRVRYKGERFIIQRNGEPFAKLEPPTVIRPVSLKAISADLAKIPRPDDRFADDLAAVQASYGRLPPPPEWPS